MSDLLMVVRTDADGEVESEPVVVEQEAGTVTLTLDDGSSLSIDREQLANVLGAHDGWRAA